MRIPIFGLSALPTMVLSLKEELFLFVSSSSSGSSGTKGGNGMSLWLKGLLMVYYFQLSSSMQRPEIQVSCLKKTAVQLSVDYSRMKMFLESCNSKAKLVPVFLFVTNMHMKSSRQWFSGKIHRCHRWAPSSILGWRKNFVFRSSRFFFFAFFCVFFAPVTKNGKTWLDSMILPSIGGTPSRWLARSS